MVMTNLEADLTARHADILVLSNTLAMTLTNLDQTQASLKTTQDELAKLQDHDRDLEARVNELDALNVNLNLKIAGVIQKLTAAEGDKAALTVELKKLEAEKAELERKFNDIAALRTQVKKIKTDTNIARRLDRAKKGLPAEINLKSEQTQFHDLQPSPPLPRHYELNVEIESDGTIKTILPLNQRTGK
jgi:chromosome segregation ATPase